jgi:hypothetical protein
MSPLQLTLLHDYSFSVCAQLSWDAAQTFCVRRGGTLTSFRSEAELASTGLAISSFLATRYPTLTAAQGTWTGLRSTIPNAGSPAGALRSALATVILNNREV